MQRFDPGFGFNGGPYTLQPLYTPAVNYNTEFPQLGSAHRPQISPEHQPRPLPQHLPGPWAASSTPSGIGYGHPETMMTPYNPNHVGAHSTSAIYLHSSQYPCQRPGMPFIHPHEQVHQSFSQVHGIKISKKFKSGRHHFLFCVLLFWSLEVVSDLIKITDNICSFLSFFFFLGLGLWDWRMRLMYFVV